MRKLVLVLSVAFIGVLNAQPDLDSLSKLPFYHCPTTKNDLKSFDLIEVESLERFGELLSIRYGCYVGCDQFVDIDGFTDVAIFLRPTDIEVYECSVMTLLSITENLFKRGILLENVNLYYEICTTTSEE
jgi:hypothetical protein